MINNFPMNQPVLNINAELNILAMYKDAPKVLDRIFVEVDLMNLHGTTPLVEMIRKSDPDQVIQMAKEQFAQGRSTWPELIRIFGKDLLKRIIRL